MQGQSKKPSLWRRLIGNWLLLGKRKACPGKIGKANLNIIKM